MDASHRTTIQQLSFALLIIFFITEMKIFAIVSAILLFLLLLNLSFLKHVAKGFSYITHTIINIISRVLLAFFFYVLFTPYALLVRTFNSYIKKDFFHLPEVTNFKDDKKKFIDKNLKKPW
jgi:hypothetical protein